MATFTINQGQHKLIEECAREWSTLAQQAQAAQQTLLLTVAAASGVDPNDILGATVSIQDGVYILEVIVQEHHQSPEHDA